MFEKLLISLKMPAPVREHRFHKTRQWRFDYAWPDELLALEVEGGIYGHKKKDGSRSRVGAHSSVTGILRDIEKYNAAAADGWRILRVTPDQLLKVETLDLIKKSLRK